MGWIIALIIFIISIILLTRKYYIDKNEQIQYEASIEKLKEQEQQLQNNIENQHHLIEDCQTTLEETRRKLEEENQKYTNAIHINYKDLEEQISIEKEQRQQELDKEFIQRRKEKEELLQHELESITQSYADQTKILENAFNELANDYCQKANQLEYDFNYQKELFDSLLIPIQQYDKDKQSKLYYTIQIPEEYHNDIDYLLNTVSQKVQHPDIINKLVWAEYVRPYIEDTFKRLGIREEPGIYKLTNIENSKSYIGKSTNIKKRITDHFKSSIGIQSIADQAVHHEILKTGIWNWSIECITYCDKDKLNELEKYYIDFFKTQSFGYNKREGG